jgi:WD40 repeat protein
VVLAWTAALAGSPGAAPLELRYRLKHRVAVEALRFSPDSRLLVTTLAAGQPTGKDQGAWLWEAATGRALPWRKPLPPTEDFRVLAFSPDGQRFVSIAGDGVARLREAGSGQELLRLGTGRSRVESGKRVIIQREREGQPPVDPSVPSPVVVAAFRPEGQRLTTVTQGGVVRVWDTASGAEVSAFDLQESGSATLSADGRFLLHGGAGFQVWEVDSGKQLSAFPVRSRLWDVAISPDGQRAALSVGHWSDSDFTAEVYDLKSGKREAEFPTPAAAVLVFSPDSQRLLTAGVNAQLWDLQTGKSLVTLRHENVAAAAFSPDGTRVATAGRDHVVRLWEVPGGRELRQLSHQNALTAVAFSPDGRLLATTGADLTTQVWGVSGDGKAGEAPAQPEARSVAGLVHALELGGEVTQVAFTPDGKQLATASRDNSARLWDVATGRQRHRLVHGASTQLVESLVVSPDGTRLVSTSNNELQVRVWDVASGCPRVELGLSWETLVFSQDATRLASGDVNGFALQVWDLTAAKQLLRLPFEGEKALSAVALSPDGTRVATVSDGRRSTELWDVATGNTLRRFTTPGEVVQLAFSPDGARLVTAGRAEGVLRVWDVASGKELQRLERGTPKRAARVPAGDDFSEKAARSWDQAVGSPALAAESAFDSRLVFSRDGKRLATLGHVWDLKTGRPLLRPPPSLRLSEAFALSADGKRFAAGEGNARARVWDVDSGRELARFEQGTPVTALAFSPDGRLLATGGEDPVARIWEVVKGGRPLPPGAEAPTKADATCPPALTASGR